MLVSELQASSVKNLTPGEVVDDSQAESVRAASVDLKATSAELTRGMLAQSRLQKKCHCS